MAVKNSIAKRNDQQKTLANLVTQMGPAISKALPSMIGKDRFVRAAHSAISGSEQLAACTQTSFIGALMNSAQLGLEPNTPLGQAYLIPYKNQCQFQIGYKGMLELARRAGVTVQVHEIKQNDKFEYQYGLNPDLKHTPILGDRGPTIGYYCIWKSKDGAFGIEVASKSDIEKFAKLKSASYNSGPWKTDFDAMAKKTVIKQALKYAPLSVELEEAVNADMSVKNASLEEINKEDFDINLVKEEKVDEETGEIIDAEVVKQEEPDQKPKAAKAKKEPEPQIPEQVDDMPEPVDPFAGR